MDNKQIELIKEYIRQKLCVPDKENKKAIRVFIRTLREADLISAATKAKFDYYSVIEEGYSVETE